MASLFEEMGGTYTLGADGMYYPNLELPEEETPRYGKYGRIRRTYLREHHEGLYTGLLLSGKLNVNSAPRATSARTFSHALTGKQPHRHGGQPRFGNSSIIISAHDIV